MIISRKPGNTALHARSHSPATTATSAKSGTTPYGKPKVFFTVPSAAVAEWADLKTATIATNAKYALIKQTQTIIGVFQLNIIVLCVLRICIKLRKVELLAFIAVIRCMKIVLINILNDFKYVHCAKSLLYRKMSLMKLVKIIEIQYQCQKITKTSK